MQLPSEVLMVWEAESPKLEKKPSSAFLRNQTTQGIGCISCLRGANMENDMLGASKVPGFTGSLSSKQLPEPGWKRYGRDPSTKKDCF